MNFEEIIREMENLQKRMIEKMLNLFGDLEKRFETGELRGEWRIEPIEKPGMRGFIAKGTFRTPEPLERPQDIPPQLKPPHEETREPLHDINEGEDSLKLYIELPGVDEKEIEIKADPKNIEVEAKSFKTSIDISRWILDIENIATEYRNGVLKVTIPKIKLDLHKI